MTFTEMCTSVEAHSEKNSSCTIGEALERCLIRAVAAERVTVGVQECAKLLGCAPERVMLCVLPDMAGSADVGLHIQHTLVRSFCWENEIRLLTVKNSEKLHSILNCVPSVSAEDTETVTAETVASCVIIEVPKEELTSDEEFVCNYHDTIIYSNIYPKPSVQLPV